MTSSIDTTAIDATKPIHGNPTTASVRDNMLAIKTALGVAKTEIEAGQAADVILQDLITALQSSKLDASEYNQHFKGVYSTLSALQSAYPTAIAGDYAQVDAGTGEHLQTYMYDLQDGWVLSSAAAVSILNTDQLTEGETNLYFTNAKAIAAVLTGFVTAGDVTASDSLFSAIEKITASIEVLKTQFYITHYSPALLPTPPYIQKNEGEIVSIETANGFSSPLTLTYYAYGLPAGLSINTTTGVISGTLGASASEGGDHGRYVVMVSATDTNAAIVYNPFVLVALKYGYDLLLDFEQYPIVDMSGKNNVTGSTETGLNVNALFGNWAYNTVSPLTISRKTGTITIPADFTFRWSEYAHTEGNNRFMDFLSISLQFISNATIALWIGGNRVDMSVAKPVGVYQRYSLERYNGVVYLYVNGTRQSLSLSDASVLTGYITLGTEAAYIIDNVMLLIGTAQAAGASSYAVETTPF